MPALNFTGVIIAILIKVFAIAYDDCDTGWKSQGDKCYWYSNSTVTNIDARSKCAKRGGVLAAAPSRDILHFLIQNRQNSHNHWIGLLITDNTDTWYWGDNSVVAIVDTIPWADGEPTGDSTCARIVNKKLKDYPCQNKKYYICESDTERFDPWIFHDGHWYYFSESEISQYDAMNYCFNNGSYLANVVGNEEIKFSFKHTVEAREYWIGLTRRIWADGSEYNWHQYATKPKNREDTTNKCFMLQGTWDNWKAIDCSDKLRYICQKDKFLSEIYYCSKRIYDDVSKEDTSTP